MIAYRHNVAPIKRPKPAKPDGKFQPGNKLGKGCPPRAKRQEHRLKDCPVCGATFFLSSRNTTCSRGCAQRHKKAMIWRARFWNDHTQVHEIEFICASSLPGALDAALTSAMQHLPDNHEAWFLPVTVSPRAEK